MFLDSQVKRRSVGRRHTKQPHQESTPQPPDSIYRLNSLETAPEKELDTGPEKEQDIPPNGVITEEEPPKGVRLWLKFAAPGAAEPGWFCSSWVGSGP